jgi:hypothetical protein
MSISTPRRRKSKLTKPEKPRPDFPLFPHATRRWAKKIRGKLHYFDSALAKYDEQKDALHAGRTPRAKTDGLTVRDLVNRFLTSKRHLLDTGEITARTFQDYLVDFQLPLLARASSERLLDHGNPLLGDKAPMG